MNWNGSYTGDLNVLTIQGSYVVVSYDNGLPIKQDGVVIVFTPFGYNTASFCVQFYIPWQTGAFPSYVRTYTNNQWYGWREL